MFTSRRTLLKAALATAATAGLARNARAQSPIELKLAGFVPPRHTIWAEVLTPWAKEVEEKSGGRMIVRMFPSLQLGGKPPELYRQMVQGISDIVFTLPGFTSSEFPMMSLTELPGVASSAEDGTRKMWTRLEEFLARDFSDAKVLMLWNTDNSSLITKSVPVRTFADCKGLRLSAPSAALSAQIEATGAVPVSMPVVQVYNAVERGTLDGAVVPIVATRDFKLIEVARHYAINTPFGRVPFVVAMNRRRYEGLPADLRAILDETTGLELSLKGARAYDRNAAVALEAARKQRDVYELPQMDHDRWLAQLRPLIEREIKRVDGRSLPGSGLVRSYGLVG